MNKQGKNLLNLQKAIIPQEKVKNYLLSPVHPVGRHKARFFYSLGYTQNNWESLENDLRKLDISQAEMTGETEYGTKFEIRGSIKGPGGRTANIITGWIILHGEEVTRFVSAYPED